MKTVLITFYNPTFRYSSSLLKRSAKRFGISDIKAYTDKEFAQTDFCKEHSRITSQKKGAGYWLWKPYYILENLRRLKPDEVLVYSDAGLKIEKDISPLTTLCARDTKGLILFHNYQGASYIGSGFERTDEVLYREARKNKYWGKRDVFVLMNCDTQEYWNSLQAEGCLLIVRKTDFAVAFIEEWLRYCSDERIVTDMPNTQDLPNHENFIMHIHDQVVLSLLAFKHKLELFRCPSQFGNHKKLEKYRKEGEYLMLPYTTPEYNSDYDTLFLHHRIKKMPFPKQQIFDIKVFVKKRLNKIGIDY